MTANTGKTATRKLIVGDSAPQLRAKQASGVQQCDSEASRAVTRTVKGVGNQMGLFEAPNPDAQVP